MELPKVLILSVDDGVPNTNHEASLRSQDYPGFTVQESTDLNATISETNCDIVILTKKSHLLRKDCASSFVAALLDSQGSSHVVYSDVNFVEGNIQFYSPQKGYDKIDFLNTPTSYQDCFAFSKAIWQTLEGFKPSPHPVYNFLLRAANHTVFTHVPSPLFYSYTNNLITERNALMMARQALLG